jgi:hypothetical protein
MDAHTYESTFGPETPGEPPAPTSTESAARHEWLPAGPSAKQRDIQFDTSLLSWDYSTMLPPNYDGPSEGWMRRSNEEKRERGDGSYKDNDAMKPPRLASSISIKDHIPALRLACPYYKRDPQGHTNRRPCSRMGWETVHRVKYLCSPSPSRQLWCPN